MLNVLLEAEQKAAEAHGGGPCDPAGPFEGTVGAIGEFLSVDPSVASHMVSDWTESDRPQFARLVLRYVEAQDSLRHHDPVRGTPLRNDGTPRPA
ncbi:hypothetical protein [Streptomyces sp. NPDC054863]